MEEITVYIMGRIVEGANMEIDPSEYYLDYETKEEAIEELKSELRKTFRQQNGESFDGHDDADYDMDDFLEALDEFDWDIDMEDREEVVERDF